MTKPAGAAFFSYSRHDTEFAQRLAQELRAAGATIWLDQLDIRPGQRWDRSVQEAVARCPRMLVILSPDSVESENVMDELSFALEKKKTVIPVLYRDCEIPFRIGRVQYVDFRSDHDKALKELLDTLNAIERDEEENSHNIGEDKEDKPKPVASQTATEQHVPALKSAPGVEKPQPERATKPTQEQVILRKSPEGTSVSTGKARMIALVAAAVLVIALGLLWANHGRSSKPNAVGVTVSPSNSTAQPGESLQFTAQVTGAAETGVTWSLEGVGSLSKENGTYVAPAKIGAEETAIVRATSKADPTKSDAATVLLKPAPYGDKMAPSPSKLAPGQRHVGQVKTEAGSGSKQAAPPDQVANSMVTLPEKSTLTRQLQLAAQATPIGGTDQSNKRYRFTLSVQSGASASLSDIARVEYDLVYAPNPLLLKSSDPSSNFSAVYEGWGCYRTVNVTLFPKNESQQPIKKQFDLCTVLGW